MIPLRSSEPHYTRATATLAIIAINVAVFLYELSMPNYALNRFIMHYGIVPDRLHYSSIITSMFIHGGFLHIAGNMWFLWIFGRGVEDLLGHAKYLFLYFACGIARRSVVCGDQLQLHRAHHRSQRRHRRRDGRVFDQVPARAYSSRWCSSSFSSPPSTFPRRFCCSIGLRSSSSAALARWVIRLLRTATWPGSRTWADLSPACCWSW